MLSQPVIPAMTDRGLPPEAVIPVMTDRGPVANVQIPAASQGESKGTAEEAGGSFRQHQGVILAEMKSTAY